LKCWSTGWGSLYKRMTLVNAILYLTTFLFGMQSQVLNLIDIETVVKNSREFINMAFMHKSTVQ